MNILFGDECKVKEQVDVRNENLPEPKKNDSDPLKKRRELFHMLTFLSMENSGYVNIDSLYEKLDISKICMPKDGTGADVELTDGFNKRAIEITECFDSGERHRMFRKNVNALLSDEKEYSFATSDKIDGLKKQLFYDIENKNKKIQKYKKDGYSNELLIVTEEVYNNCPVTGTWIEKFLSRTEIGEHTTLFDKVYILIYHASGRDGGPVIRKYPDDPVRYSRLCVDRDAFS